MKENLYAKGGHLSIETSALNYVANLFATDVKPNEVPLASTC